MATIKGVRTAVMTVFVASVLAACGPGRNASIPAPFTISDDTILAAGTTLTLSRWQATERRAVVVGVHGFGDYGASTFRQAGPAWAARGISVYAYDQRGFGRNPTRQDWPGTNLLISDLAGVVATVRQENPTLPVYVVGHSMGGGVVLAAAGEGVLEASGIILLSPATWGEDTLPLPYRASAWLAAAVLPDRRWTGQGVVEIWPSDNIEMLRALARDPIQFGAPSSREFLGLVRLSDRALRAASDVQIPSLFVWGKNDQVIPRVPVAAAFDRVPGPKTFVDVETGWHMLLRDLEAKRVHDLVAEWILK